MAPADNLSPPGSATYSSNTMTVGDGTWDFTKNTFLLPNLMGLDFETMQYNGMGNRFSTFTQYHTIVTGHGVLAAITFLFLVPFSIMMARFYRGRPGFAIKYHAYLHILAVGLTTVVFILGFFAVGPPRALTNPHHGIGVAIYVLILVQAIGGRLIRHIRGRSLRVALHQWFGRAIAILGIVQIPLGLTLYGSPKYLFVLYTLWMSFLLLLYFILSYRHDHGGYEVSGARSRGHRSRSRADEGKSSGGRWRWLAPLAAGAGLFAFLRGRRNRGRSRSRSHSRVRSRSRSHAPEVIPSRRGSGSFVEEEKITTERRKSGGGFMGKMLGIGGAVGAGALLSSFMNRREKNRHDEEYSAVETDTPSRRNKLRRHRPAASEVSDYTEDSHRHGRHSSILPAPNPTMTAAALSAAEMRPGAGPPRPITPRPAHPGHSRVDSVEESDYSSYVSPSRRGDKRGGDGVAKGLLAGLGLGWFAKKVKDRRDRREEERLRVDEEDRRTGNIPPRFTGDGYDSPSRRDSRRPAVRPPPSGRGTTVSAVSGVSEESSLIEPRPATGYEAGRPLGTTPIPPVPAGMPIPVSVAGPSGSHSRSRSRHDITHGISEPVAMPAMPPDPQGILYRESDSDTYNSASGRPRRRDSSRRRREGGAAAAVAAASATRLAAEQEAERRRVAASRDVTPTGQPVSVKVKVHDDRDQKVTFRRVTEEEAANMRRDSRRQRADSGSSFSGTDSPSARRYRRDSSVARRQGETAAERLVENEPLSPPNPAFAGGGRARAKDSAYYSGQPGPSGTQPAAGATVSSLGSPGSHGTWSGMSPSPSGRLREPTASAAERRRMRRMERREGSRPPNEVEFS